MISLCLPCFTRYRFIYIRPRRIKRHHPKRPYDVPDFDALPLPDPTFVPPTPPPPEPDLPSAFIPPPTPEGPLGPFRLSHHRPRPIPPPTPPVQVQPFTYPVFAPDFEPVIYREPAHYPEPILYREPNHHRRLPIRQNITQSYLPTMIGGYGGYVRSDDLPAAVELAVELILNELRTNDWRDRAMLFRGSYLSGDRTAGTLEIGEYIRRMNLLVQIANHTVCAINYHAEVQPKVSDSGTEAGRWPRDFDRPRRLMDFYTMDMAVLDRILRAYGISTDYLGRSSLSSPLRLGGGFGESERIREEKLRQLFEFLGVDTRGGLGLNSGLGGGLGVGLGLGRGPGGGYLAYSRGRLHGI